MIPVFSLFLKKALKLLPVILLRELPKTLKVNSKMFLMSKGLQAKIMQRQTFVLNSIRTEAFYNPEGELIVTQPCGK